MSAGQEKDVGLLENDIGRQGEDVRVMKKVSASSNMVWIRCT